MNLEYMGRVLGRLQPFVRDRVIRRTRLERVLGTLQIPAADIRPEIERLLAKAGIAIEEDEAPATGRNDVVSHLIDNLVLAGRVSTSTPLVVDRPRADAVSVAEIGTGTDVLLLETAVEQFESDLASHAPASDDDVQGLTVSDADVSDEPQRLITVAGATADPVKDYLKQIARVPLLNAEMEVELAKRMEAGLFATKMVGKGGKISPRLVEELVWIAEDGRRAKNHLIEANLRLTVSLAKHYAGRGMLFLDLIQEGNLGLIRAVEKYDYTMGYKFSTYATWWIRQSITRGMADKARAIRVPVHMVERISKVWRTRARLTVDGCPPRLHQLALATELSDEQVLECLRLGPIDLFSLDQPIGEGEMTLGDLLGEDSWEPGPEELVEFQFLREQLVAVLDTLAEREAGVVSLRFGLIDGECKTLDEIGKVYGVTRERIRQIESKTMGKLRHRARSSVLEPYMYGGGKRPANKPAPESLEATE